MNATDATAADVPGPSFARGFLLAVAVLAVCTVVFGALTLKSEQASTGPVVERRL